MQQYSNGRPAKINDRVLLVAALNVGVVGNLSPRDDGKVGLVVLQQVPIGKPYDHLPIGCGEQLFEPKVVVVDAEELLHVEDLPTLSSRDRLVGELKKVIESNEALTKKLEGAEAVIKKLKGKEKGAVPALAKAPDGAETPGAPKADAPATETPATPEPPKTPETQSETPKP